MVVGFDLNIDICSQRGLCNQKSRYSGAFPLFWRPGPNLPAGVLVMRAWPASW